MGLTAQTARAARWLSRAGDTLQKAIAAAQADCATTFRGATCILYAVNDRVAFEPR